jgi:Protein of unknown function (DUF4238)
MNRKRRQQQLKRRQQHRDSADQPRQVFNRETYSTVKQGHIIPATYQRQFAVNGRVAVHVPGGKTVSIPVEDSGTRSRAYRRIRPDGSEIDDVEASLSTIEGKATPVLQQLAAGDAISSDMKGILAVQTLRGPMFFNQTQEIAEQVVRDKVTVDTVPAASLAAADGDIETVSQHAVDVFWRSRFLDMFRGSRKLSSVFGCMRWQLLSFPRPVVAYSDQPVVIWPLGIAMIDKRPTTPMLGPLNALEVRVPLAPDLILLMTWEDLDDQPVRQQVDVSLASDTNALVIAQADKQWMHKPGTHPPIAKGVLHPISRELNPGYSPGAALQSIRRENASKLTGRMLNRRWVNTTKIITNINVSSQPTRSGSVTRRVRIDKP